MAHEKNHDYHILQPSIWPFIGALGAFVMLFGAVLFMHDHGPWIFLAGLVVSAYVALACSSLMRVSASVRACSTDLSARMAVPTSSPFACSGEI